MKFNTVLLVLAWGACSLLVGCTSESQRLANCEAKGISRDTCYLAEQNRQASINAVYEKQALENAAAAVQHGQNAKVKMKHFAGMEIKNTSTGLSIDGKPAAVIEKNKDATVYQQGLYNFIVYANGKIAVTQEGVFKGYAK
ncbi:hypothetical protein [Klebsiella oxytoca]|uniref:Lipoprotein n=1 Tax=Klebsiella oxytoca TaxID=571 RepID=A0A6B8MR63_KLEOX|nr:hypothetical protein [Klebsiella oxytoca]QGN38942.1 hypothetical protein GJ746_17295 [Klebsiella oxytoca]